VIVTVLTAAFELIPPFPERRHYAFLLSDYDAVKAKYHSIDDADAREVFVQERKALVKEIERVHIHVLRDVLSSLMPFSMRYCAKNGPKDKRKIDLRSFRRSGTTESKGM
jgi:hypothetical protein